MRTKLNVKDSHWVWGGCVSVLDIVSFSIGNIAL
jgi:hypothetical protein